MLTLKEYQEFAKKNWQGPEEREKKMLIGALGLCGEAGEVADCIKKIIHGCGGEYSYTANLLEELGDVMWYVMFVANEFNLDIQEVIEYNVSKIGGGRYGTNRG